MMQHLKEGMRLTNREPFALFTIFLFHFLWGVLFYRFIQSHVVEVMGRFPPSELGGERANLFVYESILLLQKSDIAAPFLWILLAYVATRLLLTPILHAGMFFSLHERSGPRGTVFIQGFRRYGGSFVWLFLFRLALTAIPFYWAIPVLRHSFAVADSYADLALHLAPWVIGIAIYGSLLKLLFTYILFGLMSDERLFRNLGIAFRHILPICGLALSVYGITLLLSLLVYSISLYWAGFLAILLYLAYPLLQTWLKIWGVAVQYRFWANSKY